MTARFVVDASVLIEFLAPGERGSEADRFIGGLAWSDPIELFAPDLIHLEVGNALRKLVVRKAVPDQVAGELLGLVHCLAIATVGCSVLLDGAWSLRQRMSIYDASYAALARDLGATLVTMDVPLIRACRRVEVDAVSLHGVRLDAILTSMEPGHP